VKSVAIGLLGSRRFTVAKLDADDRKKLNLSGSKFAEPTRAYPIEDKGPRPQRQSPRQRRGDLTFWLDEAALAGWMVPWAVSHLVATTSKAWLHTTPSRVAPEQPPSAATPSLPSARDSRRGRGGRVVVCRRLAWRCAACRPMRYWHDSQPSKGTSCDGSSRWPLVQQHCVP
jgi:hypothetical protein